MWIVSQKLHFQTIINLKRGRAEMIILVTKCMSTCVMYGTSDLVSCPVRDGRFVQKSEHFLPITKIWLVNFYTHIYAIFCGTCYIHAICFLGENHQCHVWDKCRNQFDAIFKELI